jgi:hypothetical protein
MELQDRIRERAYEIWNASGRVHGRAEQHWLAAERQVLSEKAAQLTAVTAFADQKKPRRQRARAIR